MSQNLPSYPGSAPDVAQSGKSAVAEAQEKVGQAVDQANGAAGQVAEQAKQQATSQLESQKGRAVDSLVTVAQALRQTGQHLQAEQQAGVGDYVEAAAERVESVTNYLRSRDVPELVGDTEDFARRQPGLFLAGAIALGFVGARFLMASGQRAATRSTAGLTSGYPSSVNASAIHDFSSLREDGGTNRGLDT